VRKSNQIAGVNAGLRMRFVEKSWVVLSLSPGVARLNRSARTRMNPVFRDRIAWKLVNKTPHNSL
jgi:hypothetical protein